MSIYLIKHESHLSQSLCTHLQDSLETEWTSGSSWQGCLCQRVKRVPVLSRSAPKIRSGAVQFALHCIHLTHPAFLYCTCLKIRCNLFRRGAKWQFFSSLDPHLFSISFWDLFGVACPWISPMSFTAVHSLLIIQQSVHYWVPPPHLQPWGDSKTIPKLTWTWISYNPEFTKLPDCLCRYTGWMVNNVPKQSRL